MAKNKHFLLSAVKKQMTSGFHSRFGGLYVFGAVFLIASFALRTALCIWSASNIDFNFYVLVKTYLVGLFYDLVTFCYIMTPMAILLVFIPDKWFRSKFNRYFFLGFYFVMLYIMLYIMLFDVAAEWFFWDEFGVRFNFIAIDYLVYTQEVVANIRQSYPIPVIFGVIFAVAIFILLLTRKAYMWASASASSFLQRLKRGVVFLVISVCSLLFVDSSLANISKNQYVDELAKNGFYSLLAAFRNNTIDYRKFYITKDDQIMFKRLKELLKTDNAKYLSQDPSNITRQITCSEPEKHYNVVILVIESLSARFLGVCGNQDGLTPNMDSLAQKSLFFRNFYATGTRTTRGLEAITLSLPPMPGRSLVKRPNNSNLFSIGPLFVRRGYEAKFIYGGRGFFDNMNRFFAGNGFETIDQSDFADDEVTFNNAWGVCDEDIFNKVLKECDESYVDGKPFLSLVMSISNHRPYSYPPVIDIPSGTGRNGAVKYTDYAIGEFLTKAQSKPWFDNTIFVIVADHCANSSGKTEVPVEKYHIPLIMYAPKIIKPEKVDKLSSQIDIAPTLLGLLKFSYQSKFFGRDILQLGQGRAFPANYQKVGLYSGDRLLLLLPKKQFHVYQLDQQGRQSETHEEPELLMDTISYYQSAAYLIRNHLYTAD